jgi:predicted nucleotidyltransferase
MNTFGISEQSYQLLLNTFTKYVEVEKVILFGSRAKGNFKKGSDIDLAIKGKNCTPKIALNIEACLNEELPIPYFVDLIDYNSLEHRELKEHIDRAGVCFYEKNIPSTTKKEA